MLKKRLNQLVDPNNHQKGLTAKGLSSFRVNLFMKRPTLKEIQSSLQQLGQTGSLLKEGTNEHKSTYHISSKRRAMLMVIVGATSAGGHTRQSPGMRAPCMVLWQPECRWPKINQLTVRLLTKDK